MGDNTPSYNSDVGRQENSAAHVRKGTKRCLLLRTIKKERIVNKKHSFKGRIIFMASMNATFLLSINYKNINSDSLDRTLGDVHLFSGDNDELNVRPSQKHIAYLP